jgi:hypothetical protein
VKLSLKLNSFLNSRVDESNFDSRRGLKSHSLYYCLKDNLNIIFFYFCLSFCFFGDNLGYDKRAVLDHLIQSKQYLLLDCY